MTTEYTNNFRLNLPDFRSGPWHDLVNDDFEKIDELLLNIYQGNDTAPWENGHHYAPGYTAIDLSDGSFWVSTVDHTSASYPVSFHEDRIANPTYWNRVIVGVSPRGTWRNYTRYFVNDMVTDGLQGVIAVCITEHVSNQTGTIRNDSAYWSFIVDAYGSPNSDAAHVQYTDTTGYTSKNNVQDAVDWAASAIHTNQGNITSLATRMGTAETNITTNTNSISAINTKNTAQDNRLTAIEGAYISEAPNDGKWYVRTNRIWGVTPKITVGTTAPPAPAVNDIWIDTN